MKHDRTQIEEGADPENEWYRKGALKRWLWALLGTAVLVFLAWALGGNT